MTAYEYRLKALQNPLDFVLESMGEDLSHVELDIRDRTLNQRLR